MVRDLIQANTAGKPYTQVTKIGLKLSTDIHLCFLSGVLFLHFSTKPLWAFCISHIRATCHAHHIPFDFSSRLCKNYETRRYAVSSIIKLKTTRWTQKTLLFENDTENKCDVLRTSRLNLLIEKNTSQKLNVCSASHMARIETIIQLVPNIVPCP